MKYNRFLLPLMAAGTLYSAIPSFAQSIDKNKKPESGSLSTVVFPKYEEKVLSNGLRVIVIEDHEQPTVYMNLSIPVGSSSDGKNMGTALVTADMLTKGAGKRSALQIAETLDGIGASVGANASGDVTNISANTIKRHLSVVLEVFSDVLQRPTFPTDELEKIIKQRVAEVQNQKTRANGVANMIARKVTYGLQHPYSSKETVQSLEQLKIDDIKNFYGKHYKPNNSVLTIVGDFSTAEILKVLEKNLGSWKKDPKYMATKIPAITPLPKGVYFAERPGSVQSAIVFTMPTVPLVHPDNEGLSLVGNIIGGGFAGRLFKTLRETYSYTYTPFGYATRAKEINRIVCGAEVRNQVTDSAIIVTKRELKKLATELMDASELNVIKKNMVGTYLRSFENSEVVAQLIANSYLNGTPMERVKQYPEKIMAMSPANVKAIAEKYIDPDKANMSIVVVGSKAVRPKIEQFGTIYDYDLDGEPVKASKVEEVSMTVDQLLEKHIQALGGKQAISGLKSLVTKAEISLQMGPQKVGGQAITKQKVPQKSYSAADFKVFKQESWCDGQTAYESQNGSEPQAKSGAELEMQQYQAEIFPTARLRELGYTLSISGKSNGVITLKAISPMKQERTISFDEKSMLVIKSEYSIDTPQGGIPVSESYGEYTDVAGTKLPGTMTIQMGPQTIKSKNIYTPNAEIPDAEFTPSKK